MVTDLGDRLIFLTNADGAIDWKIGEKPLSAPVELAAAGDRPPSSPGA